MGKYEPLTARLQGHPPDEWAASFEQIEKVLGFPLPPSARRHRGWWGNQRGAGHSQARGWQDAGWQVWKVDLELERVIFRRRSSNKSDADQQKRREQSETGDDLFDRAADYLGTTDRTRIVEEALKALCEREAARRLARLAGTMPDLKIPPRRRFG